MERKLGFGSGDLGFGDEIRDLIQSIRFGTHTQASCMFTFTRITLLIMLHAFNNVKTIHSS